MEMYLFNEEFIDKFLDMVLGGFPLSALDLLARMAPVLTRVYLMRLANEALQWGMRWVTPDGELKVQGKRISFDEDAFIEKYLTRNGKGGAADEFRAALRNLEANLDPDERHSIRGHDFTKLLLQAARKMKARTRVEKDHDAFVGILLGCLESHSLEDQPLFARLAAL
jgi:hypothetical protein